MRIRAAGSGALLACLDDAEQVTGLYRELEADPPKGFVDAIPAAETVMVVFDPARTEAAALGQWLQGAVARAGKHEAVADQGPVVTIPVTYDGPDLNDVAMRAGLSIDEVVRRHAAGEYVVAFCGFAPGFGYLTGLDPALRLPRRTVPRTRIPAGSVAIADRYTSVYPTASPGGWHLLGRTTTAMWDIDRQPPALLTPGTRVRFEAI
ncbi:MAG TPA: allophanate hydrolase subunit 1 [Actinospica sp.]|jgi:KipI family sensor histidine kinase inhibitor|nr:allophanate hydrolase subunit 1 [Actinospica sp.]